MKDIILNLFDVDNKKELMHTGVYIIELNKDVYIGSTTSSFYDRIFQHIDARKYTYDFINKGAKCRILEIMDDKFSYAIREKEQEYINKYIEDGYNVINHTTIVTSCNNYDYDCKVFSKVLFNRIKEYYKNSGYEFYILDDCDGLDIEISKHNKYEQIDYFTVYIKMDYDIEKYTKEYIDKIFTKCKMDHFNIYNKNKDLKIVQSCDLMNLLLDNINICNKCNHEIYPKIISVNEISNTYIIKTYNKENKNVLCTNCINNLKSSFDII